MNQLVLGGDMVADSLALADLSSDSIQLERMTKRADEIINESNNPDVIDIWKSLTSDQKKVAVQLALRGPSR